MFKWDAALRDEHRRIRGVIEGLEAELQDIRMAQEVLDAPEIRQAVQTINNALTNAPESHRNSGFIQRAISGFRWLKYALTRINMIPELETRIRELRVKLAKTTISTPVSRTLSEEDILKIIAPFDWLKHSVDVSETTILLTVRETKAYIDLPNPIPCVWIPIPEHTLRITSDGEIYANAIDPGEAWYAYDADSPSIHPHVVGTRPCFGDFAPAIEEAFATRDLATILTVYKTFLSTINWDDSAGLHWVDYFLKTRYEYDDLDCEHAEVSLDLDNGKIIVDNHTIEIPEEHLA